MRKSTLLIALLVAFTFSYAQDAVSIKDAKQASLNFIAERVGTETVKSQVVLTLQQTVTDDTGTPLYYRFQVGDRGFIIVSATDLVAPVLAFSLEANYEGNSSVEYMLDQYENGIKLIKQYPELADKSAATAWQRYTAADFQVKSTSGAKDAPLKAVEPLTTSNWDQGRYYNTLCPFHPNAGTNLDNKAPTGCVATAMSGMLYYYRYPNKGRAGISYQPPESEDYVYPRQTVLLADQNLDYNAMTNTLSSYNDEVAKLMYYMGVSAHMMYGAHESGAYSEFALGEMKDVWKYSNNATMRRYAEFTAYDDWAEQVLKPELDAMCPLYYSAQSQAGGHAWIVDGYIEVDSAPNTFYHCNWGWGGGDNGFFKLGAFKSNAVIDGQPVTFNIDEAVFAKLVDSAMCVNELAKPATSFERNTAHSGTISDGAGNVKYQPNSDRKWIIAAPNTNSYTFNFEKIKTTSGEDFITIYNGATEASGIAIQHSGNYLMGDVNNISGPGGISVSYPGTPLPPAVTVTKDSVLVTFTSNSNDNTDYGFLISYTSTLKTPLPSTCSSITPISTNTGRISDKANATVDQTANYSPSHSCRWNITPMPNDVVNYWINFEKFDLKAGDYIDIYNTTNTSKPYFIVRYSIHNQPPVNENIRIDSRRMRIDFLVDNKDEGSGFIMNFNPRETSINDIPNNLYNVSVYPNPAQDMLNVELTTENTGNINFNIVDITGKQISSETVKHFGGTMTYTTSVSNLPKGMYFVYILTNQGKTVRKFVVE